MLAMACNAGGGLLLAKALGPSDRGDLATAITWPTFTALIALVGLPQAVSYWSAKNRADAPFFLTAASLVTLGVGSLLAFVGWLGAPLITGEASDEVLSGLRIMFAILPLMMIQIVWTASLQPHHINTYSLLKPLQPITYLGSIVLLFFIERLTLVSAVLALSLSFTIQAAVTYELARTRVGFGQLKAGSALPLMRYGSRAMLTTAPYLVNQRLDILVLSLLIPPAALGNYAVAVGLTSLALPIGQAIGSVAFPRISSAATATESDHLTQRAIGTALVAGAIFLATLAAVAPHVIPAIFGAGFAEVPVLIWFLVPATLALTVNFVIREVLNGLGHPLSAAAAEALGAVMTVALLLVLVPIAGARGAAVTSLIAYSVTSALLVYFLRRRREGAERNAEFVEPSGGAEMPS